MAPLADYVLLIDGYNVLYRRAVEAGRLAGARRTLLEALERARWPVPVTEIHVFFDAPQGDDQSTRSGRLTVRYLPSADDGIQAMIRRHPAPERLLVVSDDGVIQRTAASHGAAVRTAAWLAARLAPARAHADAIPSDKPDLPAAAKRRITEELARRWLAS